MYHTIYRRPNQPENCINPILVHSFLHYTDARSHALLNDGLVLFHNGKILYNAGGDALELLADLDRQNEEINSRISK